jgi:tetratricopeptide (TPR) repeat protein
MLSAAVGAAIGLFIGSVNVCAHNPPPQGNSDSEHTLQRMMERRRVLLGGGHNSQGEAGSSQLNPERSAPGNFDTEQTRQRMMERSRTQAEATAAETAKAFAARLQGIEQALTAQRAQELEAVQSSNKVMLVVAGLFAALGLLAMLFMSCFQWRTIDRLAEISAALPMARALGTGPAVVLLGALERLEKRIHELEHKAHPPLHEGTSLNPEAKGPLGPSNGEPAEAPADMAAAPEAARIALLLGKGQSLLNLDQAEEALGSFDQALALDPSHPEALVKKGAALERLRKPEEAIACYDRAIAADSSLTVAYLYKGGLFNRMERFGEALECYEEALRTQEARRG